MSASIFAMFFYGFKLGIDFTGGAMTEISYVEKIENLDVVKNNLNKLNLGGYLIQTTGDNEVILKTRDLSETERVLVANALSDNQKLKIDEGKTNYSSVDPTVGKDLKNKAIVAILLVMLAIVLFVSFVFRKVSEAKLGGISSWKYGVVVILILIHDVIVPTGIFVFLSSFFINYQIDILFVTALLAILGYSVNDTIVVFDRIRENIKRSSGKEDFGEVVVGSLVQTFARSINTSLTTLLALLTLFFFGGETTKQFALVLSLGVIFGTYSSIFLASPLLVVLQKLQGK